jgi:conjugal transfer/type IV secretion protein DotA/TraY
VLTLALWSVGFANGLYKLGMSMGIMKADGIVATSYQAGTYYGMRDFAKQYLASAYCARSANAIYTSPDQPNQTPSVMADSSNPDKKTVTGTRTDYTFYVKDRNANTNLGGGEPICGTVTLTSYSTSSSYSDNSGSQAALDSLRAGLSSAKLAATTALMKDIDAWVATMPSDLNQTGWDGVKSAKFNDIVKSHEDQIAGQIASAMQGGGGAAGSVKQGASAFIDSLTNEGWAMSAAWYQRVGLLRSKLSTITSESVGAVSQPSMSGLPSDVRAKTLTSSVSTVVEAIIKKSEEAGNGYEASKTPRAEDLASLLPSSSQSDINVGSLSNDLGMKLTFWVNSIMQGATNTVVGSSADVDAVSRMKLTGDLLASYRAMLLSAKFAINTTMTAARVIVSGVGGVQVLGTKVDGSGAMTDIWDWLQAEITPALADLARYIGILAFYFSVILPSLPYTIFMITVVGWLLGVLQTVIAAPLWATMHMRPSQTFVGSDAQGYLLLLAMFVRPALAVLGLFAAMLVADPIVDYITKAFFAMRGDVVASTGFIGAIAQFWTFFWWFTAYGMLLLPVLYMVYGLPQVLPDHVLKWLNAGVHDLGATGAIGAMQSRMQPAATQAGMDSMRHLGGGGGGGGNSPRSGPQLLGSGGAGSDGEGRNRVRSEPINAGMQGIVPNAGASQGGGGGGDAVGAGAAGAGFSGPGKAGSSGSGSGGRRSQAMAGGQGAGGTGQGEGSRRGLGDRLSDGAGIAIGRALTDSTMALRDAAAGGREGFAGRAAANMMDAVRSAGTEGAEAFKSGADSRVASFKSEMALRGALHGDQSSPAGSDSSFDSMRSTGSQMRESADSSGGSGSGPSSFAAQSASRGALHGEHSAPAGATSSFESMQSTESPVREARPPMRDSAEDGLPPTEMV